MQTLTIRLYTPSDEKEVIRLYERIGFTKDRVISMGKRLITDSPFKIDPDEDDK